MDFKEIIPWWEKIISKVLLARLRIPYGFWRKLHLFQHGSMLDASYALSVFNGHNNKIKDQVPDGYALLELGPGDSVSTGIIAAAHGACETILVDAGPYASTSIEQYRPLLEQLGLDIPIAFQTILKDLNIIYMTEGLRSLRNIPSSSIDVVISNAVMEHIYLNEFEDTIRELYRIQKPGGVSNHQIDFKDHLAKSLNSLRFSKDLWEAPWFARSGFYTNRLRAGDVTRIFLDQGYSILSVDYDRWDWIPLNRKLLHADFSKYSDEDLKISGMNLLVKKNG